MLLAGGQGSRLRVLTKNLAKPAVPFGGQYRIVDFSLSNCANSGIDTVGVLTQYKPQLLNSYIGQGSSWDLSCHNGGVTILPPYVGDTGGHWYNGTAHAVYQNLDFIDRFCPCNVLILSGDHIYKMDYTQMLNFHKEKKADVTIAVIEVPWDEAGRFGLMSINEEGRIISFEEKPPVPKSNLASMGVYLFKTEALRTYLELDAEDIASDNDFGKNVIPRMLQEHLEMYAYPFYGYWRDVGTIDSYWSASMDILDDRADLNIFDRQWAIYSFNQPQPPHYVGPIARIKSSLISEGCIIDGDIAHSIIFPGVDVAKGVTIRDSVIMSSVHVGAGSRIEMAIVGENTRVGDGSIIGGEYGIDEQAQAISRITIVEDHLSLAPHSRVDKNIIREVRP